MSSTVNREPADLAPFKAAVSVHLDSIRGLFTRPDDVKITVVVRAPWLNDGDVVLTNDEPDAAIKSLLRLIDEGPGA